MAELYPCGLSQKEGMTVGAHANMTVSGKGRGIKSHVRHPTKADYPPEVFELVTDILADLVLEDVKKYPELPIHPIDSFCQQGNTAPHIAKGRI